MQEYLNIAGLVFGALVMLVIVLFLICALIDQWASIQENSFKKRVRAVTVQTQTYFQDDVPLRVVLRIMEDLERGDSSHVEYYKTVSAKERL